MKLRILLSSMLSLLLVACSTSPQTPEQEQRATTDPATVSITRPVREPGVSGNQFILVEPVMPSSQRQVEIAQISQLMLEHELSDEQMAILLYRRGALYDALGMSTLARIDFNQVLEYRPGMSDAYNYIGIHATQAGDFETAFEAFDSALELDPEHPYVYLNRGITAYYSGQYDLAQADFADYHYQDEQDAYRVIWLFFAEYELEQERAYQLLSQRKQHVPENWEHNIIRLFTGEIDAQQLIASTLENVEDQRALTERLAEAYFYLAKYEMFQGYDDDAANYLKLALATNIYDFIEHRYAPLELERLRNGDRIAPR
ncbi:lipoprotein NlpI [Aliidiomarina minuta]|nr:lipoprotein NlpI [Aliidiomarina minuta]